MQTDLNRKQNQIRWFAFVFLALVATFLLNGFLVSAVVSLEGAGKSALLAKIASVALPLVMGFGFYRARTKDQSLMEWGGLPFIVIAMIVNSLFFYFRWTAGVQSAGLVSLEIFAINALFSVLIFASVFWPGTTLIKSIQQQLSSFAIFAVVALVMLEGIFRLVPTLIPPFLINSNPHLVYLLQDKSEVIEEFDTNPWAKFRPNIVVSSVHPRGKDFSYSWKTDSLGFKNLPSVRQQENLRILAIGDSFVEAMGVSLQDSWTNLLNSSFGPTYSLGVQGYAPRQITGSLERFGKEFRPEYVVYGYTPGFEDRELGYEKPSQDNLRGGLKSIADTYMSETRGIYQHFMIVNSLIDLSENRIKQLVKGSANDPMANIPSAKKFYCEQVVKANEVVYDSSRRDLELTKDSILKAKEISQSMGAKFVLLIFAQRNFVYHDFACGTSPPDSHFEVGVRKDLKDLCAEHNFVCLDVFDEFLSYMKRFMSSKEQVTGKLPYFLYDGHPNAIGNKLIADYVARALNALSQPGD